MVREAHGTPVCSVIGSASSSARTATVGPSAGPMRITRPVFGHHRRVRFAERGRDPGGGGLLGPAQVGRGVQLAAQRDGVIQLAGDALAEGGVQVLGLVRPDHCPASPWESSRYTRRLLPEPMSSATCSPSAADQAPSATNAPMTLARSRRNPMAPR